MLQAGVGCPLCNMWTNRQGTCGLHKMNLHQASTGSMRDPFCHCVGTALTTTVLLCVVMLQMMSLLPQLGNTTPFKLTNQVSHDVRLQRQPWTELYCTLLCSLPQEHTACCTMCG